MTDLALHVTDPDADPDPYGVRGTISLTPDEYAALQQHAVAQRRTPEEQAAVYISEAVGCWQKPKASMPPTHRARPSRAKASTGGQG